MAANPSIAEVLKKNVAFVLSLAASILMTPPQLDADESSVKWLAINGVIATIVAAVFAAQARRSRRRYVRLALTCGGLLLVTAATYFTLDSQWVHRCGQQQEYRIVVGERFSTRQAAITATNLLRGGLEPNVENMLNARGCNAKLLYSGSQLLPRYFSLIGLFLTLTILLMATLFATNYLLYYHVTHVPGF